MATSGITLYTTNSLAIYEDALRLINVLEEGESASAQMKADDLGRFEKYIKSLSVYGLTLWTLKSVTITLVQGQQFYAMGEGTGYKLPLRITDMVYTDDTVPTAPSDTPMIPLTREEYVQLNDKLEESSQPTQYYYEKLRSTGNLYIWPLADANVAGKKLGLKYITYLENVNAIDTTELDCPAEWLETITYGLAVRLSRSYGIALQERRDLRQEYKDMFEDTIASDTEYLSIYFQPEYNKRSR